MMYTNNIGNQLIITFNLRLCADLHLDLDIPTPITPWDGGHFGNTHNRRSKRNQILLL